MHILIAVLICFTLLSPAPAQAERETIRDRIQEWRETREHRQADKQDIDADNTKGANIEQFHGREILVYVPQDLKPAGTRAMVMVFHGGGGNAGHIRKNLELDKTADQYGFIVAYLNGTQAMRIKNNSKSWNGGGKCCGKAFENNIDDVGYIENAAHFLSEKYGIDENRIYGMGHSNGGIIIQRTMCERGVLNAIIPISGPLNIDVEECPAAMGKRILAIHGQEDINVLIGGGYGEKSIAKVDFKSQAYSKAVFEKSGAQYTLLALANTDHSLKHIMNTIVQNEGISLGEKAALFFGITQPTND